MRYESILNHTLSLGVSLVCLLFCACSVPASDAATDNLTLRVEVTTGEHSKDSSSRTTFVTVGPGNKIIAWESESGGRRTTPAPVRKEYTLSAADKSKLIAILRSGELLTTRSIELERDPATYQYFELSIESFSGGKSGMTRISGSRTAVQLEKETLYQNSIALINELYRIIRSQGGNVGLPALIVPKRMTPQVNSGQKR